MKQKISEEAFNKLANSIWEDFLKNASQEAIYHAVLTSNWDSNAYLLQWIMNNKNTDKAIILAVYWSSNPSI